MNTVCSKENGVTVGKEYQILLRKEATHNTSPDIDNARNILRATDLRTRLNTP